MSEPFRCEWTPGCTGEVVAKIGLPGAHAIWVCYPHFDAWRARKKEARGD